MKIENAHATVYLSLCICRFLLLNAGSVYLYSVAYQKVDEEEFGGTWEILKEGFMTSYTLFLVRVCMFHHVVLSHAISMHTHRSTGLCPTLLFTLVDSLSCIVDLISFQILIILC